MVQAERVDHAFIEILLLEVPCQVLTAMCLYGKRIDCGMPCIRTVILPIQEYLGAGTSRDDRS